METKQIVEALFLKLKKDQIHAKVSMKLHTTFKAGGEARLMALPVSAEEICYIIECCKAFAIPYYIMGNGSNLLVRDTGYEGLIIKLGDQFNHIEVKGNQVVAQAGALLSSIAKEAADHGLAGLESASGIPGSIGGAVVMNAGAYGWEMKDSIVSAKCLTPECEVRELSKDDLKLSYRHSVLQDNGMIVTSAVLNLETGDPLKIKETMQLLGRRRNERQPVAMPSAGSTFKRPPGNFAAKLIEEAGLKGLILGGAQVSPLHAGFIINNDHATAGEILQLIELVKLMVFDTSGVKLEEEIKILG